jgi:ABC-2 type transport system permease protein
MLKNTITKYSRDKKIKIFLITVLATLFLLGEYRFFYKIFNYLQEEVEFLSKHLTIQLVNIMNITFLSMLFFSNLTNAIYYFYISDDIELLLSYPIKIKNFILTRYLLNTFISSWMVIFAMIPFYLALFKVFNFVLILLILTLFLYIFFFFMQSSLGCIITILIVNYFPAKRAYQVLWSISALFIASIFIIIRLIRPERLFRPVTEKEFMNFLKSIEVPDYPYLPSTWLTKAFSNITFEKNLNEYLFYFSLIFIFALFCFGLFYYLSKHVYLHSYSRARSDFKKKKITKSPLDLLSKLLPLKKSNKELFLKDLKEILRDTGQWSQLLLLIGLVFVYLFSIKSLPIQHVITMNMVAFFNVGILEFIMAALINRFVFPSFSQEGKVLWVVKSFPISIKDIFLSKFLLYSVPLLILGIVLSIISNELLNVDKFIYFFTIINVSTMTLTLIFFGLTFGIIYPKFRFSNITEVSFSYGGIVYMLVSMIYIGLSLIIQAGPVYSYLKSKLFVQTINYKYFILSFGIFFISSIILCIGFYNKSKKIWESWE